MDTYYELKGDTLYLTKKNKENDIEYIDGEKYFESSFGNKFLLINDSDIYENVDIMEENLVKHQEIYRSYLKVVDAINKGKNVMKYLQILYILTGFVI